MKVADTVVTNREIIKVADVNHESRWHKPSRDVCDKVCDKPVCVALMEFSPLQCTGKVRDKVRDKFPTKSRTQIMKVGTVICVADFHDLHPRLCRELVAGLVAKSV